MTRATGVITLSISTMPVHLAGGQLPLFNEPSVARRSPSTAKDRSTRSSPPTGPAGTSRSGERASRCFQDLGHRGRATHTHGGLLSGLRVRGRRRRPDRRRHGRAYQSRGDGQHRRGCQRRQRRQWPFRALGHPTGGPAATAPRRRVPGGGIYLAAGNLTLNNDLIAGNLAQGGAGGTGGSGGYGYSAHPFTFSGITFRSIGFHSGSGGYGGNGGNGGSGLGGGLYVAGGSLSITGSTLTPQCCRRRAGGQGGTGGRGGWWTFAAGVGGNGPGRQRRLAARSTWERARRRSSMSDLKGQYRRGRGRAAHGGRGRHGWHRIRLPLSDGSSGSGMTGCSAMVTRAAAAARPSPAPGAMAARLRGRRGPRRAGSMSRAGLLTLPRKKTSGLQLSPWAGPGRGRRYRRAAAASAVRAASAARCAGGTLLGFVGDRREREATAATAATAAPPALAGAGGNGGAAAPGRPLPHGGSVWAQRRQPGIQPGDRRRRRHRRLGIFWGYGGTGGRGGPGGNGGAGAPGPRARRTGFTGAMAAAGGGGCSAGEGGAAHVGGVGGIGGVGSGRRPRLYGGPSPTDIVLDRREPGDGGAGGQGGTGGAGGYQFPGGAGGSGGAGGAGGQGSPGRRAARSTAAMAAAAAMAVRAASAALPAPDSRAPSADRRTRRPGIGGGLFVQWRVRSPSIAPPSPAIQGHRRGRAGTAARRPRRIRLLWWIGRRAAPAVPAARRRPLSSLARWRGHRG